MSRINKYGDFMSEEFFNNLFNNKRKKKIQMKNTRIESCVQNILNFLKDTEGILEYF